MKTELTNDYPSKSDPSDWIRVRFCDIARKVNVKVNRRNSELKRYVAGEHMRTDDLHIKKWGIIGDGYLGSAFNQKFVKGQILYGSRRTYLRKVAIADFDGICANTTFVIEPHGDKIMPELLPFLMQSKFFTQHSVRRSKGSTNPYINWKDIANFECKIPTKEKQKEAADILLSAEDCIAKTEHLLQAQISYKEILMHELFHNGIIPEASEKTRYGNLQIDWTLSSIKDVCDINLYSKDPKKEPNRKIRYIDISAIENFKVVSTKEFMGKDAPSRARRLVFTDDVIVSTVRPYLKAFAKIGEKLSGDVCSTGFAVLTPKDVESEYLFQFVQSDRFVRNLKKFMVGSNYPAISAGDIGKIPIPLASEAQQEKIAKILSTVDITIQKTRDRLLSTRALKLYLINNMLVSDIQNDFY